MDLFSLHASPESLDSYSDCLKVPEILWHHLEAINKKPGLIFSLPPVFDEHKDVWLKDPVIAAKFADARHKRWPEAEPIIAQSPEAIYIYATRVLERRWPEAEPVLLTDLSNAFMYARNLNTELPGLEDAIAKEIKPALSNPSPAAQSEAVHAGMHLIRYARNVMRHRLRPRHETLIAAMPVVFDMYMAYFVEASYFDTVSNNTKRMVLRHFGEYLRHCVEHKIDNPLIAYLSKHASKHYKQKYREEIAAYWEMRRAKY